MTKCYTCNDTWLERNWTEWWQFVCNCEAGDRLDLEFRNKEMTEQKDTSIKFQIHDESYKLWYKDWISKVQEWLDYYRNNLSVKVSEVEKLIEKRWQDKRKEYDNAESDIWTELCREIELDLTDLLPTPTEWN